MVRSEKKGARGRAPPARGGRGGGSAPRTSNTFNGSRKPAPEHPTFSLQDEANHTGRNASFWSSDMKLRNSKISFVSAGKLEGDNPVDALDQQAEKQESRHNRNSTPYSLDGSTSAPEDEMSRMSIGNLSSAGPMDTAKSDDSTTNGTRDAPSLQHFYVDTSSTHVPARFAPPHIRCPSPTPSASSEEEIVFKGRGVTTQPSKVPQSDVERPVPRPSVRSIEDPPSEPRPSVRSVIDPPGQNLVPIEAPTVVPTGTWDNSETPWVSRSKPGIGWSAIDTRPLKSKPQKRTVKARRDEAIEDYIQNVQQSERLELEAQANEPARNTQRPSKVVKSLPQAKPVSDQNDLTSIRDMEVRTEQRAEEQPGIEEDGWESAMMADFDDISTSSDVMDEVVRVLSRRVRKEVVQYLVVYKNSLVDDARWLPSTFLNRPADLVLIASFEDRLAAKRIAADYDDDDDNDDDDDGDTEEVSTFDDEEGEEEDDEDDTSDDDHNDTDSFEDEQDLVQRRHEQISDEAIARLLAKQEDLGLGSAELFLFDGGDGGFGASGPSAGAHKKRKSKKSDHFPSATLMADVLEQDPYGGFDVMDFDRPSLKPKRKGRKAAHLPEMSDEELEAQLRSTWETDRMKKKQLKEERQELRAQGLLGKKSKRKLYERSREDPHTATLVRMKEDIKTFMISSKPSMAFPPMENKDRALLHQFAKKLNLQSKSSGAGSNRFTTLSKTDKTRPYEKRFFDSVEALMDRRIFPKAAKGGASRAAGRNNAGASKAATYRDGDVVGSGAAEIGEGNRGRAMMEKMGWAKGTALGAVNNPGIMLPIEHVVKTSKAGLG